MSDDERDGDRVRSYADAKEQEDDFEQLLREKPTPQAAVDAEMRGEEPDEPGAASAMP